MTANDLIAATLQDLGVLLPTEAPSNEDATVALRRLNRLIDGWKLERLMIHSLTRTTWTIAANDGSYTWGSAGQIAATRPSLPQDVIVRFIDTSTDPDTEHPLEVLSDEAYARIPQKAQTALWPVACWLNPTHGSSDAGLATLELWPVPTSSDLTGVAYVPTPLSELATLTTDFYAPPGYRRLYETALAVELADAFNRKVTDTMLLRASQAVAAVKRVNQRLVELSIDPALTGGGFASDIYSGQA